MIRRRAIRRSVLATLVLCMSVASFAGGPIPCLAACKTQVSTTRGCCSQAAQALCEMPCCGVRAPLPAPAKVPRDQMQERVEREFLSAPSSLFAEEGAKAVSSGRNPSTVPNCGAVSLVAQHTRLQV